MLQNIYKISGWLIIMSILFILIFYQYTDWLLPLAFFAYICLTIAEGRGDKIKRWSMLSIKQLLKITLLFILSIVIVFGLIQCAKYIIDDLFDLTGFYRTISVFIAIILSLYPVKFTFWSYISSISEDLAKKYKQL